MPQLVEGVPEEGEHPEIDLVRRAFRLLQEGDREHMLALFDEKFEGRPLSAGRAISGRSDARAFLEEATSGLSDLDATAFRFERNGRGQVGVFGRLRVRRPDGIIDTPAAWICWISEGRIVRGESYTSMVAAQRALRPYED